MTGYRAPSFSIDARSPWAYAALAEAGGVYADSRRDQMELVGRVIPPLMLLGVGAFLVVLTVSLFLPLVKIIEGLT